MIGGHWLDSLRTAIEGFRQALARVASRFDSGVSGSVTCMCLGLRSGKRALAEQMNRDLRSRGFEVHRIGLDESRQRKTRPSKGRDARRTRSAYLHRLIRVALL